MKKLRWYEVKAELKYEVDGKKIEESLHKRNWASDPMEALANVFNIYISGMKNLSIKDIKVSEEKIENENLEKMRIKDND